MPAEEPIGRNPLFSDADIEADIRALFAEDQSDDFIRGAINGAHRLRMLVHAKITSGELRVVKTCHLYHPLVPTEQWTKWLEDESLFPILVTKCCRRNPYRFPKGSKETFGHPADTWLCPGCGAQILTP